MTFPDSPGFSRRITTSNKSNLPGVDIRMSSYTKETLMQHEKLKNEK